MPKHSRTKLVPPKTKPEHQFLETIEESSLPEQKEEPVTVLDNEIECPPMTDAMRLWSYTRGSMNWHILVTAVAFC